MLYADKEFYQNEYLLGKAALIPLDEFLFWSRKAGVLLDLCTFGDIDAENVPEIVKMCVCELAELYFKQEQAASLTAKRSESVGDWSVSYADQTIDTAALAALERSIVVKWLGNTNLLFRGAYR